MFKEECIKKWEKEMEEKYFNKVVYPASTFSESELLSPYAINLLPTQYSIIKSLMDNMTIVNTPFTNKMLPKPKHVQVNGDYTTVVWKDNTSTVIKRMEGEPNDPEKAILFAVMKKIFDGKNADMKRYLQEFEDKTVVKEKKNKKKDTERSLSEVKEPPKIELDCEYCKYKNYSWDVEPCCNCRRSVFANGKKENNFEPKETYNVF